MLIYTADTGTRSRISEIKKQGLGILLTPRDTIGRSHHHDLPIAMDNGAWRAYMTNEECNFSKFIGALEISKRKGLKLNYAVAPDIVGGGENSLELSVFWASPGTITRELGYPFYLAVQDGMTTKMVEKHIHLFAGIFVGGTMEWKFVTGAMWVKFAHELKMKCHIGRCGTIDKMIWAESID